MERDTRAEIINPEARLDWGAAVLAGLATAAIAWLLSHGIPWFTSGMVSPTLMGRDLKPPGELDAYRSTMTILAQAVTGVVYALIIALGVTRFRGLWAVGLGTLIGVGLYLVNLAVFKMAKGVDWSGSEWQVVVTHIVFGAVAAGAYKGLAARRSTARAGMGRAGGGSWTG